MQRCPTCNRNYPDNAPAFCPNDGTHLVSDAQAYNPQPTVASPPPVYQPQQQYPQQPYQPQAYAPQQWGQPAARGGNKTPLLVIIGLVVAVGVGLTIYLLTKGSRSSSTGYSPSYSSSASPTGSNGFVGTWVAEEDKNVTNAKTVRFTADGKVMGRERDGSEEQVGTYTANGNKATITAEGQTGTGTLESDNLMRLENGGKTNWIVRR